MTVINNLSNGQPQVGGPPADGKIHVHSSILAENPLIRSAYCGLCGWIVEEVLGRKRILLLTLPSVRVKGDFYGQTQYKFVGGKDDKHMEFLWEIMCREFRQEALRPKSALELPGDRIVRYYHEFWEDQVWLKPYLHLRVFWALPLASIPEFKSANVHFRRGVKNDWDKNPDGTESDVNRELLLEPHFINVEELARGLMFPKQLRALAMGIQHIASFPSLRPALSDSLLRWTELEDHTPNGRPIYFR